MTNAQICNAFIDGKLSAKTPGWQLNIYQGRLFSYGVCLAEWTGSGLVVYNLRGKYSTTTSRHVSTLLSACWARGIRYRLI